MAARTGPVLSPVERRDTSARSRPPWAIRWWRRFASLRTELIVPYIILTLLIAMVGYAVTTGHFVEAVAYLFEPDFSKLSTAAGNRLSRTRRTRIRVKKA